MPPSATLAAGNTHILAVTLSSAEAAAGRSLLDIALAEEVDPAPRRVAGIANTAQNCRAPVQPAPSAAPSEEGLQSTVLRRLTL